MDGATRHKLAALKRALEVETDPIALSELRHEIALTEALLKTMERIKQRDPLS